MLYRIAILKFLKYSKGLVDWEALICLMSTHLITLLKLESKVITVAITLNKDKVTNSAAKRTNKDSRRKIRFRKKSYNIYV